MRLLPEGEWHLVDSLSADADQPAVPASLARLIGQHPSAVRSVCFHAEPQPFTREGVSVVPPPLAHLEIETKHGQVTLIDHRTGLTYTNPPAPPEVEVHLNRQQRDLADELPGAFANRPRFSKITPLTRDGRLRGWRFEFDTGAAFILTLDEHLPIVAASS